ncbi:MAG: ATP-binding domain-containing protein, partial [Bdellovibrionales bacterium]|nr:ATP-binding domain-containing protein [Bdellovibrionales bacterium]
LETLREIPVEDLSSLIRFLQARDTKRKLQCSAPLKFGHVVVDELQDYSLMGLATLIQATSQTKNLTLVGDAAQALSAEFSFVGWERLKEVWKIEEGEDASFITLEVSHRCSLQIMQFAASVTGQPLPRSGRPGRVPIWFHCAHEQSGVESALRWISTATERYPSALSAVLCRSLDEATLVLSLLKPTFGPLVRLGRRQDFSFDAGIVVAAIDDVKGIEFANVLLWNPSHSGFDPKEPTSKNRLYVAATRAQDNLCIVTWGRYSALLPNIHSRIVRGYDFRDQFSDDESSGARKK